MPLAAGGILDRKATGAAQATDVVPGGPAEAVAAAPRLPKREDRREQPERREQAERDHRRGGQGRIHHARRPAPPPLGVRLRREGLAGGGGAGRHAAGRRPGAAGHRARPRLGPAPAPLAGQSPLPAGILGGLCLLPGPAAGAVPVEWRALVYARLQRQAVHPGGGAAPAGERLPLPHRAGGDGRARCRRGGGGRPGAAGRGRPQPFRASVSVPGGPAAAAVAVRSGGGAACAGAASGGARHPPHRGRCGGR